MTGARGRIAGAIRRLDHAIDEIVDHRALIPLRVAVGPLVIAHLWPELRTTAAGAAFDDSVVIPFIPWYPVPPPGVATVVLALGLAAAALTSIGLFTRVAAPATAAVYGWWLFLSDIHYHHNRAFLLVLLVGVALTPLGGSFSLDALIRRRLGRYTAGTEGVRWPLMLLRFQVSVVYLASGIGKLLDADWFGGTVTRLRVQGHAAELADARVPGWILDLAQSAVVHGFAAPIIVLAEIFIGVGLLVPRWRNAAVWVAIVFHLSIEVTAQVQTFSFAALAALVIWVAPVRWRRMVTVSGRRSRVVAIVLDGLDWTGRFVVSAATQQAPGIEVCDCGAGTRHGTSAAVAVAQRLPLCFPVAWPLSLVRRRTRAGNVVTGRSAA